jgi:hypothetical protein
VLTTPQVSRGRGRTRPSRNDILLKASRITTPEPLAANIWRNYGVAAMILKLTTNVDGGEGIGVAVMIFEDRETANAANDKVMEFVHASLHDLNFGEPEIIAGKVLVNIESYA